MAGSTESTRRQLVMSALERHEGVLMRYAARMLGDQETAGDVVQHAFVQLCSQSDEQFPKHPKPWLFKVCRNRILDLMRKAGRTESLDANDTFQSDSAPDPAVQAEQRDLGTWLQTLVDQLSPSQRDVIVLWCQGLRYGQIAEITDQKEGAVRVRVHRGLARLREHPAVRALLATEGADCDDSGSITARKRSALSDESLPQRNRVS